MVVTIQKILTELGHRAWSGFNLDDMDFESENSLQAQSEVNAAIRYLISLRDFPFKTSSQDIITMKNISDYSGTNGQISAIYNEETKETLKFIGDNSKCDMNIKGEPAGFWFNYNNPDYTIRLYPIPDKKYNLKIIYNSYYPIIGTNGTLKFEFTQNDDMLNLPQNLAFLFMDCLILRTMQTNNKDSQDENYGPTVQEFQEAWANFVRLCNPIKLKNRVVW